MEVTLISYLIILLWTRTAHGAGSLGCDGSRSWRLKGGEDENLVRIISEGESAKKYLGQLWFAANNLASRTPQQQGIGPAVSTAHSRSADFGTATGNRTRLLWAPNQCHRSAIQPFDDRGPTRGRNRRQHRNSSPGNPCF